MPNLSYWIKNPGSLMQGLSLHGFLNWVPDKVYLKILFRLRTGQKLNLNSPTTFNQKLQWLKLYNRREEYTSLADKFLVRDFIKAQIGDEYLIPLLGVYDRFEDIDFSSLPNRFVIKCNHDSGGVVVVRDKTKLDLEQTRQFINKCMNRNFYYASREPQYKNIKRKIIVEEYLENPSGDLIDYKFVTINGKVEWIFVCTDRFKGGQRNSSVKFTNFDAKWNKLPFAYIYPVDPNPIPPPHNLEKMVLLAEKLGKGIPQIRVDFYEVDDKIYFGELTFFTEGGMGKFTPEDWDAKLGEKIILPRQ